MSLEAEKKKGWARSDKSAPAHARAAANDNDQGERDDSTLAVVLLGSLCGAILVLRAILVFERAVANQHLARLLAGVGAGIPDAGLVEVVR